MLKKSDYEFLREYKKDVIKEINNLRERGATYEEIAKKLNSEGVEPFHSGSWHTQSVHRVYTTNRKTR